MSRRSLYTIVTPLPPTISRETAVAVLHNHTEMIELNPLVINHVKCKPPPTAPADEFHCIWYELTDKITYLPGVKGTVNYKACFHDLPRSIQTHVYAPAGLEIKEKWSIGGNEPHEEREVIEIGMAGLGVPRDGLYLREDVDMKCNLFLTNFVKKTLRRAHEVLVERLVIKADLADDKRVREGYPRDSYFSPRSSVRSPTLFSLHDAEGSVYNSSLNRGNSTRSDAASSVNSAPTVISEMPSHYQIAELPAGGLQGFAPAPLKLKSMSQEYDARTWAQSDSETPEKHPARHPSNAYGIPPEPVELEGSRVRRES